jgi:lipoprotein-anchoring transpeptidase ErfK/SrfK
VRSRRAAAIAFAAWSMAGCAPVHRAKPPPAPRPSVYEEIARDASPTYLLLRLAERRLYLVTYEDESSAATNVESFPVAVGRPQWQTPTGVFRVTDKLVDPDWVQFDWNDPSHVIRTVPPGPDNPLGRRWIGFASGYGWQIGFHGTPHPELLGQAVSHGCVRMRNEDVVKVYDRVTVGTVVIVQP